MKKLILALSVAVTASMVWAAAPEGYYDSLNGKKKEELKYAAKAVAHDHTEVSYGDDTWEAFLSTDVKVVDGTGYWWDMYSNNLVEADGHNGLNIEHAVPNSWWGKTKNAAYKDLFHLNPSDAKANNAKSYWCLGEVGGQINYDNGVTKVGKPASGDCYGSPWVFEPADMYKGDFARAYMYMFTVYDTDCNWKYDQTDRNYMFDGSTYPTLRPWAYQLLIKWNELDPVDDKERNRNEAIYEIQGNRNPFIDHPELAQYIWGNKTEVAFYTDGRNDDVEPEVPTPNEYQGAGTLADPYTVADIIKLAYATGSETSESVYFKGYVTSIKEISLEFGNATFNIADEPNGTPTFQVYRILDIDGEKFTDENKIKVGDLVTINASVTLYGGNIPETVFGKGFLVSVESEPTGGDTETPGDEDPEIPSTDDRGTVDDPYDISYVKASTQDEKDVWVEGYIAGYVSGMAYGDGCHFTSDVPEGITYNGSNILLAPVVECTNADLCIPVQLPAGDIRNDLGLNNNPSAFQNRYKLRGDITNYFGMRGLKNVKEYIEFQDLVTETIYDSIKDATISVTAISGGLTVSCTESVETLRIVDLSGRTVAILAPVAGQATALLPGGFYVVAGNGAVQPVKVLVK